MTNETQIKNLLDKIDLDATFLALSNVRGMIGYLAKSEVNIEKAPFEILQFYLDKVINECHDNMFNYTQLANLLEDEFLDSEA